ncbi:MAG: AIR synthase family protein [Eubacteriales bacterium]|nr:AIR synthase family protein [Eubacteriales bacterium]
MRLGKLDNETLERIVLSKLKHVRGEVVCAPGVGVDCAAVDMGGRLAVLSTDPITAAGKNIGRLTVHVSCNDAAAAGAEPIGLLITLLAPPETTLEELDAVTTQLAETAALENVEILGGHTEITDAVTRIVTCAAVLAKAGERGVISPGGMKAGDSLVLTKHAGLEGASIIASEFSDRAKGVTEAELKLARGFIERVSVVKEGLIAAALGASAMHDVTEGGVLGAAWEMAFAAGLGVVIDADKIPVHPVTKRLCETFSLDPLRLISSGCMLIAIADGEGLADKLRAEGIDAAVIGRAQGDIARLSSGAPIEAPEADELYKLF